MLTPKGNDVDTSQPITANMVAIKLYEEKTNENTKKTKGR
jgi:hypothetical protein